MNLEAIVAPEGPILEALPLAHIEIIKSVACRSLRLWETPGAWHDPSKATGLMTTPGIILLDKDIVSLPSDPVIRFYAQWVVEQSREGGFVPEKEWGRYWKDPYKVSPKS